MVDAISNQGRVFSSDKKIYSGMTVREASNKEEAMQIFNFADKDGNGKIDDFELKRYDGPIIQYDDKMNAKVKGRKELTNAKYELYTGQKIEDVPKEMRDEFVKTDVNKDGELSLAEMARKQIKVETGFDVEVSEDMSKKDMEKLIGEKRTEKKNVEQAKNKINIANNKPKEDADLNSGAVECVGTVGCAIAFGIESAIVADEIALGAICGLGFGMVVTIPIAAAVGVGTYYISRHIKRNAAREEIAKIEQQYGNIPEVQAQIAQLKKDNPWLAK